MSDVSVSVVFLLCCFTSQSTTVAMWRLSVNLVTLNSVRCVSKFFFVCFISLFHVPVSNYGYVEAVS